MTVAAIAEIANAFAKPKRGPEVKAVEDRIVDLINAVDPQAAKAAIKEGRDRETANWNPDNLDSVPLHYPRAVAACAQRLAPDDPIRAAALDMNDRRAVAELASAGHRPKTDEPLWWAINTAGADCSAIRALGAVSPPLRPDPEKLDRAHNPDAAFLVSDHTLRADARVAAWLVATRTGFTDNQPCPPIPEGMHESVAACVAKLTEREPDETCRLLAAVSAATGPDAVVRDRLAGDVQTVERLLKPLDREHDVQQQHRQLAARGIVLGYDKDAQHWIASRDGVSASVPALAEVAEQALSDHTKVQSTKWVAPVRKATPTRERKLEMPGI